MSGDTMEEDDLNVSRGRGLLSSSKRPTRVRRITSQNNPRQHVATIVGSPHIEHDGAGSQQIYKEIGMDHESRRVKHNSSATVYSTKVNNQVNSPKEAPAKAQPSPNPEPLPRS